MFSCVYITCLLTVAWRNVNIIAWQSGNICIIIQRLLNLALVSNIILRFLAALVLLIKVIYPPV